MLSLNLLIFVTLVSILTTYTLYREFRIHRDVANGTMMILLPLIVVAAWVVKYAV